MIIKMFLKKIGERFIIGIIKVKHIGKITKKKHRELKKRPVILIQHGTRENMVQIDC